jgi:hypothetical protein
LWRRLRGPLYGKAKTTGEKHHAEENIFCGGKESRAKGISQARVQKVIEDRDAQQISARPRIAATPLVNEIYVRLIGSNRGGWANWLFRALSS